eukprot:625601-Prorocentrum_lima.AAC.1
MTSSLVGSEMCIRDSIGVCEPAEACRGRGCGEKHRSPLEKEAKWGGALSVSYTHLTLPTICSV